ncbi:MAG TPA: UDP-N-acetylglucosamine 4,6-dehydratase (inverting) [Elusimicrobia bacterium]|nr:UDP-N-acetylglucosamine 4,6-dehydratase (inverting) [Elusimicrobiota bacterium]HBT60288.1 UDP-N-acetylglucosamine 4,6-dehydratase (inverting) [Elusimicrobiota bacterium]
MTKPARRADSPDFIRSLTRADFKILDGRTVLVTGGTGSFGKRFIGAALELSKARKLIVFSRDELKQSEMAAAFKDSRLRFFIGDVRDLPRLRRAFHGVDFVVHAAALKQVPTLEYNPFEAVLTNVMGSENIINAAIDEKVSKVVALSTDKAVNPINLYGATKLCAEKLFIAGNSYAAATQTRLSVVRYGNVVGSRGSVIPLYLRQRSQGVLPVTDERMTRFWITLDGGVRLVLRALELMQGGEVFVPKIPSMRILDLIKAMAPECSTKVIGIRPGEKLHEALLTEEEAARTLDLGPMYLVKPSFPWWGEARRHNGSAPPEGFRYTSDANDSWLTADDLRQMISPLIQEAQPQIARA